ncbi:MAG TPA: YfiR family protein [Myxococcaceae bacterium]|jgi:hypothetical protein
MRARAIAIAALLLAAPAALAAEQEVSMAQQAVLLLKILKFDRALEARSGGTATIAVVYLENDPDSEAVRAEILSTLEAATHTVNFPLPVKIVRLPYNASRIEKDLAAIKPVAAYIAPGLEAEIGALGRATRKQGTLTFTEQEAAVRGGLSIGLIAYQARPAIMINLNASKAEGADLSSDLLRLSKILLCHPCGPDAVQKPTPAVP